MKLAYVTLSRRHVQLCLGWLWILDGALQLQHQLFTSIFGAGIIDPVAEGQPLWVGGPIHFFVHILLLHPAVFNTLIALIQLALGVCILWKRAAAWALTASVVWGLFVWSIGEGYGGIFNGQASLLMGAPGAALLYALLALAVRPGSSTKITDQPVHDSYSQQPAAFWLVFVWALVWLSGAFWQVTTTGMKSASDIKIMIQANAEDAPRWLAHTDHFIADGVGHFDNKPAPSPLQKDSSDTFAVVTAVLMVFVGLGIFVTDWIRWLALAIGMTMSLLFWISGQNLGGYYTGLATDPGTGPLLILLGLALLDNRIFALQSLKRSYESSLTT